MRDLKSNLEDAWVSCWLRGPSHHPGLERLPPRLWEPLRQRLQSIYRGATGEGMAVLSSSSGSAAPVAVKALEWEQCDKRLFQAPDGFGRVYWVYAENTYTAPHTGLWLLGWRPSRGGESDQPYANLAAAKAAAQADFNARIRSALSASPLPEEREQGSATG